MYSSQSVSVHLPTWLWGPEQDTAFTNVKKELTKPRVLALYNPEAPTKVCADASSYGLGAVLMQKQGREWKPIAYASRSMTETEQHCAQIEKGSLGNMGMWEVLHIHPWDEVRDWNRSQVTGTATGDKATWQLSPKSPMVPVTPGKIQLQYQPCTRKLFYTADTLSRVPSLSDNNDTRLQDEAEMIMELCVTCRQPAHKHFLTTWKPKKRTKCAPLSASIAKQDCD